MPKSARPRKRYRPGRINPLAFEAALIGTCRLTLDDRLRWQAQIDDALTAIARGQADTDTWRVVFDAANLVEEMVTMKLAADPDDLVREAQDAVVQILDRQRDTGVRAVRAAELAALRTLVQAWAELLDGITHQQKFDAEQRVAARVARVLRQPTPPAGVRVVTAPASLSQESAA